MFGGKYPSLEHMSHQVLCAWILVYTGSTLWILRHAHSQHQLPKDDSTI